MMDLTDNMDPYLPSMKLDYDAGRELELESIYLRPIEIARKNGVDIPELEKLYTELRGLK